MFWYRIVWLAHKYKPIVSKHNFDLLIAMFSIYIIVYLLSKVLIVIYTVFLSSSTYDNSYHQNQSARIMLLVDLITR